MMYLCDDCGFSLDWCLWCHECACLCSCWTPRDSSLSSDEMLQYACGRRVVTVQLATGAL